MAPASKPPAGKGGGSFFTNKVGPLPMWGWIAVAVVGVIIYRKVSGSGSGSSSTSGTTSASDQAALLNAQAAADYASLTTAGGSYSGPVGGAPTSITDPTTTTTGDTGGLVTEGMLPPDTTATTPGPTAAAPTPGATPASYLALTSPAAIQGDINQGQTLYQSGTEAQAWDLANGTPAGQSLPDPNQYYALSGPAAVALGASGKPVYVQQGG
jgi:hypothetical protein